MKKTIRDIDVSNKRVFVRVDYNVPMNSELKIMDDTRIVSTLPTINYLIDHGAKVILCSHLGRPNGQVDPKLSLRPVLARLSKLMDKPISFAKFTGTAFPTCLYFSASVPQKPQVSGKVCILAFSL